MKPLKLGLRVWIAITTIFSFLGGWALFSHSGKPAALFPSTTSNANAAPAEQAQPSNVALPTLAPIPSLNSLTQGGASAVNSSALQPLPSIQQSAPSTSFFPRLRTRGS
ncbi:MAG TPA: hypothetical protein VF806_00180 [Anaerolineaceae bacterium]